MSRRLRDIARLFVADRRGAIAAMTAVLATTLVGFGGLAAETAFWYAQKRALQTQADAAALSGAYELLQGDSANAGTWATRDAVLNGFNNTAPNSISSSCSGTSCQVTLTLQHSTALASAFLPTVTIKAQARADLVTSHQITCAYALGTGANVVQLKGNPTFSMPNCVLSVPNSSDPQSLNITGSSTVALGGLWTHGGYTANNGASVTVAVPPFTYIPTANVPGDPYAGSNIPSLPASLPAAVLPCGASTTGTLTPQPWTSGGSVGVYKALSVGTQKTCSHVTQVTLVPGIYFVVGGDDKTPALNPAVDIGSNVTVTCPTCNCKTGSGITIVIVPDSSTTKAGGIRFEPGATVNLCAAPSGLTVGAGKRTPGGLLIYQCDTSSALAACHGTGFGPSSIPTNGSTGSISLTGSIYLPSSDFTSPSTSGNTFDQSCIVLIAKTISLSSKTNFSSSDTSCTSVISTGRGSGKVAVQTQRVVMTQ